MNHAPSIIATAHAAPLTTESCEQVAISRGDHRNRREEILDGAAAMFAQHGYHGSSLRVISSSVGISHPGMLHHFPSKGDLLGAVIGRLEARALEAMDNSRGYCSHPQALLRGLAIALDPSSPSLRLLAMLSSDAVDADHPGHFRMARLHKVYEHILEDCYTACAENGWLRPEIDPQFAARATVSVALALTVRDRTVRAMQRDTHDDSPVADLQRLVRSFLVDAPQLGHLQESDTEASSRHARGSSDHQSSDRLRYRHLDDRPQDHRRRSVRPAQADQQPPEPQTS